MNCRLELCDMLQGSECSVIFIIPLASLSKTRLIRNNEARSRIIVAEEKRCVTYFWVACVRVLGREGVCIRVLVCSLAYPAGNTYAPYCDNLWPLWLHHIFRHYLVNSAIFGQKLLHVKCVFSFSQQILSKTFLILRRI
jgi:hypothetical protein